MKRFLIIISFLLLGGLAFSQTTVPPSGTWTTARNIINANFVNTYDSIAANRLRVNILNDSILAYATAINLRLLKSDTASMLANYTRNGELNSALAAKVNVSDTAAMLAHYALTSELGDAGTSIGDVRDEIADSLNVLRPLYVAAADTAAMLDPYAKLTDLSEGGIGIGAVQEEIADSLNVLRAHYLAVVDTASMLAKYALLSEIGGSGDVSALETRVDSIVDVLADTANIEAILLVDLDTDTLATKAYARSVGGGGTAGITLNSGTLTLDGDEGTADDITFYTNGDGSYNLPAGGGNLTIMSEVQGWINDSLDKAKVDIRKFDSDTIPLFVFGLGSGHSTDTALFNNGRLAGAFYNSGSDTLYVTELRGVLVEGTGTETIDVQVSWHANMRDVSAVDLNTSALTINNMTTGTSDVSFNNNGIPPGRWVWCVLSGASSGNKPTALMLTMTGYRRNRSY